MVTVVFDNVVIELFTELTHKSPLKKVGLMAILLTISSSLFSLLSFPPLFWVVDGQALAHISAAPLPLIWGHFAASDCLLLDR